MAGHWPCADPSGAAQGNQPRLELADIVRRYRPAYQAVHPLTLSERAVLDAIERCRTLDLGGHVDVCLACGHRRPSYNSCHNRHCPKCLAVAQAKWIAGMASGGSARDHYLFPVEVLGKLFRGKMLAALRRARTRGELAVADPSRFAATVARLYQKDWVVYCKRPFGGPEQVIRYLGQYIHGIALSNSRLVVLDERGVTFRTNNGKQVTVDGVTFLARWLSHVLPPRFVKLRHHGLMSAAHATTRLEVARQRLLAGVENAAVAAGLAIDHGYELVIVDGDFARFAGLRYRHPLA